MSSSEPSRLFSEEILQKLETLQNSVQEVNEMFDEPCSNSRSNSGIYFAQIVYVQWWSWLRIHHPSPASASIIAIAGLIRGYLYSEWSHWSACAIHQCWGQGPSTRPSHTDVNVRSIIAWWHLQQPQPEDVGIMGVVWIYQPKVWLEFISRCRYITPCTLWSETN